MAFFKVAQRHLNQLLDKHCTMLINGIEAKLGDTCTNGGVISLVADDGFRFYPIPQSPPSYTTLSSSATMEWFTAGKQVLIPFDVITDPEVATWVFPQVPTGGDWAYAPTIPTVGVDIGVYCNWLVETEQFTPEVYGSNNAYVINNEILAEINSKRFNTTVGGIADYGQYILSVLQIPSSIDPNLILEPTHIQLGNYNSEVLAPELSTDNLRFDMGSFEVPQVHNNLVDFSGVVCNLHLPFSSSVVVDTDYVIGQTLSIEYLLDCYTGVATINLSSSKVGGEVFYTTNTSLGINIPYISGSWGTPDNSNIDIGGVNHILKPYLEVIANDAILIDGFFTIPIIDESVISGNIGFIQVQEIDLAVPALSSEIDEIKNILSSGVIIK